jgi:hypothetical protein
MSNLIRGRELQVGDTIELWYGPKRGTITEFGPHDDPHNLFGGEARVAEFAQTHLGMTIEPDGFYTLLHRAEAA